DADTIIPQDFLEEVSKFFEKNDVVGATCSFTCIEDDALKKFSYFLGSQATRFFIMLGVGHFLGFCSIYERETFMKAG
ncbi:MAG: hypothetical protein ABEJ72_01660, partial [Candidatus Aenigmatarchaeota archaeon]